MLLAYQGFERGVATFYDLPGIPFLKWGCQLLVAKSDYPTILVVQEHREVRDVLIRELQTKGYLILEAQDAVEALKIVVRHSRAIHLLLTDDSDQARIMAASLKPYRSDMNVIHVSRDLEPGLILKEISKVLDAHGDGPEYEDSVRCEVRAALASEMGESTPVKHEEKREAE